MASPVADSYTAASGTTLYCGRAAQAGLPAWVSALPLWQWYAIPNTALSSVAPSPQPPGNSGPSSKINAWCGATMKRTGSVYMLGAAGGHSDYCGNEVDTLVLNTATPVWVQSKASSVAADIHLRTAVYKDLRRSSSHTYWSTQFDNVNNRMLIVSTTVPFDATGVPDAAADWPYPNGASVFMGFDIDGNEWLAPSALPPFPFGATASADMCTTDPVTGDIYFNHSAEGHMWRYSPTGNAWTSVGNWYLNGGYAGSAIDHTRGRLLSVGDSATFRLPELHSIVDASVISATFGGLGASALVMNGYPGVVFDEANDCYLVAKNSAPNIEIYRVNGATLSVDMPAISGSIAQRPNSICNAFQYVPELRGVVIANSYTGNVQFMRTAL